MAEGADTGRELRPLSKVLYASGDFTLNTALSALSLVYAQYFLVQVAEMRPVLAGLIPLIGRTIDAFFDPLMGRISDRTRWRSGRRRPWFLIGALPFGALFALMWTDAPFDGTAARFAWYAAVYTLMNLAMSVLTVPYVAIQPEMAIDYDARTSLNIYRTFGGTLGIFAAVTIEPIAHALGSGKTGFAQAGILFGVLLAAPWLAVHRATFERPGFAARRSEVGFREAVLQTFRHRTFMQLTGIYIMGRIAMDLAAALLILFTTYWIGRREDFTIVMALFLGAVVLSLPGWLALARGRDKSHVFVAGSLLWMAMSAGLAAFHPDTPRWAMFLYVPLVGIGFAVVDVMPWSMVGEVIDEDDLETGERREGLYNGMFSFLRKLGGALGVFVVMSALDLFGYEKGQAQAETARQAIRWMTALAPVPFLAVGVCLTRGYPLTRRRHREILDSLAARAQRAARAAGRDGSQDPPRRSPPKGNALRTETFVPAPGSAAGSTGPRLARAEAREEREVVRDLERAAADQWPSDARGSEHRARQRRSERSREAARDVRDARSGRPLRRGNERHHQRLACRNVHLREGHPQQQAGDGARRVGHEAGEHEERVRREVRHDHRPHEADPRGEPRRRELRQGGEQVRPEEDRARGLEREIEALEEPEREDRLDREAAAEGIEAEEGREGEDHAPRARKRSAPRCGARRRRGRTRSDARQGSIENDQRAGGNDVDAEGRAMRAFLAPGERAGRERGQTGRERTECAGEPADEVVAGEERGPIRGRRSPGQQRLLRRQEDTDVPPRRIERSDEGDDDERNEGREQPEAGPGHGHQRAGQEQHRARVDPIAGEPHCERQHGGAEERGRDEDSDLDRAEAQREQVGRKDHARESVRETPHAARGHEAAGPRLGAARQPHALLLERGKHLLLEELE